MKCNNENQFGKKKFIYPTSVHLTHGYALGRNVQQHRGTLFSACFFIIMYDNASEHLSTGVYVYMCTGAYVPYRCTGKKTSTKTSRSPTSANNLCYK
jgi:hypothetical protein